MSKDAESWVWNHSETNGNDRLALLFLADQGDDDGTNSFPSLRRVAEKCRINVDTARRVIARLEEIGEILVERPERQGRGYYNRYTLVLGRPIEEVEALARKTRDLRPFGGGPRKAHKVAQGGGRVAPEPRLPTDPQTPDSASGFATREPPADDHARAGNPPKRKTQIPSEWMPSEESRAWARSNVPSVNARAETDLFIDYWKSRGAPMADWEATWRNWIRRAATYQRPRHDHRGNGRGSGEAAVLANLTERRLA